MCNFLQQLKWTTFIEVSLQVFFSNSEVKNLKKKKRTDDSFAWKVLRHCMSLWKSTLLITNSWLPSCQRQSTSCIFPTPHNLKKTLTVREKAWNEKSLNRWESVRSSWRKSSSLHSVLHWAHTLDKASNDRTHGESCNHFPDSKYPI